MFDELKEVKCYEEVAGFNSHNVKCFKEIKLFEESSKRGDVFWTQVCIYSGAFLWIYLTAYYFRNKNSIIDNRPGYMYTPPKILKCSI